MPLTYNTKDIKYFDSNPDELNVKKTEDGHEYYDLNPETKSLVFGSMIIDIGHLTSSNAPDFYARWKILEAYDNFCLYQKVINGKIESVYLTPDVVIKHIGLSTNVTNLNKTMWIDKMVKSYERDKYIEVKPTKAELTKMYKEKLQEYNDYF